VYTFGQPRVGDAMLGMFVERNLDRPKKRHLRFTYGDDSLPRLPNESSAVHYFLHFGLGLHFDKSYRLKVIDTPPILPLISWKNFHADQRHACPSK